MNLSDEARTFLDTHRVGHLATVDAVAVTPHVVPLCYARVDDRIYFVVDDKPKQPNRVLKRLRNIATCPRVALVVDDYDEDWNRLAYLLLHCTAARVNDATLFATVLRALQARYPQYRHMPLAFATHPMLELEVVTQHLWRATNH